MSVLYRNLLGVLLVALLVIVANSAHAKPQQGRVGGYVKQRPMEAFRAHRQAERQARLQNETGQSAVQSAAPVQQTPISSAVLQNQSTNDREQNISHIKRLTPEERIALRRQIRDARKEIYLQQR